MVYFHFFIDISGSIKPKIAIKNWAKGVSAGRNLQEIDPFWSMWKCIKLSKTVFFYAAILQDKETLNLVFRWDLSHKHEGGSK